MERPAAIVFDFDGTIADTEWPVYVVWREVFEAHGLELPIDAWVDSIGRADNRPLEEVLIEVTGREPDESVISEARARREESMLALRVLPGVIEVIAAAQRGEVALAIASSSPSDWVESHLERLGLLGEFPVIRTRDHVDRGKPAPDLFLSAAGALGVDPGTAVAIEDSRHGCTAAKTAGMACVVVPNRITSHDPPTDADWLLESLLDFPFGRFGLSPWSGGSTTRPGLA